MTTKNKKPSKKWKGFEDNLLITRVAINTLFVSENVDSVDNYRPNKISKIWLTFPAPMVIIKSFGTACSNR